VALVVLDAGVVIAVLDTADSNHAAAVAALREHAWDDVRIPASALAEALVSPSRRGVVQDIRETIASLGLVVVSLDEEIAVLAAGLRARRRTVRLPDALVAATGDFLDADVVLTTDRRLARLPRFRYVS
jgi:predicted nucleic acid-binding protein